MNHIPDKPPLQRTVVVKCPGCLTVQEKFDKRGNPLGKPTVKHKKGCKIEFKTTLYSYDGETWARNGATLARRIEHKLSFLERIGKPESAPTPPQRGVKAVKPMILPLTVVGEKQAAREKPMRRRIPHHKEVVIRKPVHEHVCLMCSTLAGKEVKFVCSCDEPMWRKAHIPCPAMKG